MKNNNSLFAFALLLGGILIFSCQKDEPFINTPPVIEDQEFSINENIPNGTLVDTVKATDIDKKQILKYYIISGNFENAFKIDSLNGIITVNNKNALDYEFRPIFELGIKVKDNYKENLSSSANVTILLNNLTENKVIANQAFEINRNLQNGATVGAVIVNYQYDNQGLTFSILSGNFENAFVINPTTGVLTINNFTALNYENRSIFELTISVKDDIRRIYSSSAMVKILINDAIDIPLTNLIAYYPFNGNANDITTNNLNCVANASLTTDRFGNSNRAYYFNGVDQYINFNNSSLLKPQFPFTISFWVKLDRYDNSNQILTTDYKLDSYTGVWFNISINGNVIINYGNDQSISLDSRKSKMGATKLNLNQWYHITGAFISSSQMEIFINGINDGGVYTGNASSLVYSNNPGSIGRKDCGNSTQPPYFFNGSIDEIAIYNKALNQNEINSLIHFK